MPKYKVLRPIEHSLKLYLPEMPDALTTVKSSGNGGDIPVDATGAIELREKEAKGHGPCPGRGGRAFFPPARPRGWGEVEVPPRPPGLLILYGHAHFAVGKDHGRLCA